MREMLTLERILNQVTDLYQQILINQDKSMTPSPEILEDIRRLAREIEDMSRFTDMEIARMGISPQMIKKTIFGPKSQLSPDMQNLLEKSQYLKSQLEGCRNILKEIMKKHKAEKPANKKLSSEKRKDKFKNVGGKKGWIPL